MATPNLILWGLLFPHASLALSLPLPRGQLQRLLLQPLNSLPSAVALDRENQGAVCHVDVPETMVPISCPPLLLLQSSSPIMNREACSLLTHYFDCITNMNDSGPDETQRTAVSSLQQMAEKILNDVHDVIDEVTNCPRHDGESMSSHFPCRYVRYDSTLIDAEGILDCRSFGDALLPDGLHVDTSNGKLFRHITAILYLTDNQDELSRVGGGTTFPLATPIRLEGDGNTNHLQNAARRLLLDRDIHHTKQDIDENPHSDGRMLERAGLDIFHRDNMNEMSLLNGYFDSQSGNYSQCYSQGLRVMPEAGKLIYFHNVGSNGYPDPLSFHGGEELLTLPTPLEDDSDEATTKSILVFFKEIPLDNFSDRDGFAKEAQKARQWTMNAYYE